MPGAEQLDFRSVFAFNAKDAYLLSSGDSVKSKLFHTSDAGQHWSLLYTAKEGFLDGIKFWNHRNGIILGDAVGGTLTVLTTTNAGQTWQRQILPPALPGESAFAASNSSVAIRGTQEAWFGTSAARVFHTIDAGKSWTISQTPLRHHSNGAGIFSLFFTDARHGIAVGGDYTKPTEDAHNVAITSDGGLTWTESANRPQGYRSACVCVKQVCLATGPLATDISHDGGLTWNNLIAPGFHALTIAGDAIFASGSSGRIRKLTQIAQLPK